MFATDLICESGTESQTMSASSVAVCGVVARAPAVRAKASRRGTELRSRQIISEMLYPAEKRCLANALPSRPGPTIAIESCFTGRGYQKAQVIHTTTRNTTKDTKLHEGKQNPLTAEYAKVAENS